MRKPRSTTRARPARVLTRALALFAVVAVIGGAGVVSAGASLAEEPGGPPSYVITEVAAPTVTAPTCASDGTLVLPTQEHLRYTVYQGESALAEGAVAGPGDYRVVASAKGMKWTIEEGVTTEWALTVLPKLPAESEECANYEPVDLCSNLDGVQETVPAGYVANEDGTCSPVPADEGELKPVVELTATCGKATWTVTNPNAREEGEDSSMGGKPIHFFVIIDQVKTGPTVLLPGESVTDSTTFGEDTGDHVVTINAGNGRAGAGHGSGSGSGESATGGHSGGSGTEGHGPAVTKTVTVGTDCATSVTPPAAAVVGQAAPDATIVVKGCEVATITLTNYTVYSTSPDATFTVTANGQPWGNPVVVGGGEKPVVLTYTRTKGVAKAIELQVLADGTVLESATLPVCAEVEGVVIPGAAAPAQVEATTVAAETALPATGAGSTAALALVGGGLLVLGGALVAWSMRRPQEAATR